MSTSIEAGLPVEIGQIDKQLGKLWEDSGDTKTRASLINLAIYTQIAEAVAPNTELISQIAAEHACRALLIYANPSADESGAKAWISAHCHLAGKGERQVCSEQITFQLYGEMVAALPNLVFSHLDSDLPLYFWWQGEFPESFSERLWNWIDRLIFDSAEWSNPAAQLALARQIEQDAAERTVLCDLNWTRLFGTRYALAQLFDHSSVLAQINSIKRVVIETSNRMTGLLLLGWLAAQLKWSLQGLLGKNFFLGSAQNHIDFEIKEVSGPAISRCSFESNDFTFEIARQSGESHYQACMKSATISECSMMIAAGRSKPAEILLLELSRGGRHPMYAKALAAIESLI